MTARAFLDTVPLFEDEDQSQPENTRASGRAPRKADTRKRAAELNRLQLAMANTQPLRRPDGLNADELIENDLNEALDMPEGRNDDLREPLMGVHQPVARRRSRADELLLPELARVLMGLAAAACAGLSLLMLGSLQLNPAAGLLSVPWALLALLAAGYLRVSPARQAYAVTATGVGMSLLLAFSAWTLGQGLASPILSVLGLLVLAVCAVAGWHAGLWVAAAAVLGLLGVAVSSWPSAEADLGTGLARVQPGAGADAFWGLPVAGLQLLIHGAVLAVGSLCGLLLARHLARQGTAAREREARLSGLLALAADAYWEVDQHYKLVSVTLQGPRDALADPNGADRFGVAGLAGAAGEGGDAGAGAGAARPAGRRGPSRRGAAGATSDTRPPLIDRVQVTLGQAPWQLPQFGCDPDTLDELLADLDARQAFHNREISWALASGEVRQLQLSGEPRFDARGVFTGFWGVTRDVTQMHHAHAALLATELRYQELFARIPTALVLHHDHVVIDANPAALQLFGHRDRASLVGSNLLAAFEGSDSLERARQRADELREQPMGTALPVTEFKLLVGGRARAVRSTSVMVPAEAGVASLSIFVDDTERLAAEEATRRSEAMLSHLVATSPDLIMLADALSGRIAMVNQAFELCSGYRSSEVVGQSMQELQMWPDEQRRALLLGQVMTGGSISDQPITMRGKGGRQLTLRVSAARFEMDRRDYIVINGRDISDSEHVRLERETIFTHASIGIAVTRARRFVSANPHFEHLFGWPPGQLAGQPSDVAWPHTDARADFEQRFGAALNRGEPVSFETTVSRRDGSSFVAHVRARGVGLGGGGEGSTVWIVEDVTDRRDFELALAKARDDAEAASRAKSSFLANTSHELRTPLNGLIGLTRMARDAGTDERQRQQYLDQIAESAQALSTVITDILDVSKIEAGKLLVEHSVFDLGRLLLGLQGTYAPLAEANRLRLHFDIEPAAMGHVSGDPQRVRQILGNYIANALKFTPQGQVRVRVQRLAPHGMPSDAAGERVRFEVSDTGPGIAQTAQDQLFKSFSQGDASSTRRFGGNGLGLSINRELAALLGGEVGVISDLGQGSTFWVELPLPPCAVPPTPSARKGGSSLDGMRVLMVEDNPVNMMIAVAMLKRWGVQVTQVANGREAVQAVMDAALNSLHFDAVLMDVQMPVMNGHEATRELRKTELGRQLPIIALTAAALGSEREEALRAGMNDFLTKPIDAEKLRETLLRCCRTLQ